MAPRMSLLGFIVTTILVCGATAVEVSTSQEFLAAVEAASLGETIEIQSGSYKGVCGVHLTKSLTVAGDGEVSLDCEGQAPHLSVQGSGIHVTISNLAFANGVSNTDGGCISVSGGASLDLTGCSFSKCVADGRGGGIFVHDSAQATFRQTSFSACAANEGGAVGVEGADVRVTLQDCIFINNSATADGGGVLVESASIDIDGDTLFQENVAARGGGIAAHFKHNSTHPSAITIGSGAVFRENRAQEDLGTGLIAQGGAIYFVGLGSLVASAVTFFGNSATSDSSQGGAVSVYGHVTVLIAGEAEIKGCSATMGAAMWIGGGAHVELRDGAVISHNTAFLSGGAFFGVGAGTMLHLENKVRVEHNSALTGGAMVMAQGPAVNLFHDVEVSNNVAHQRGGGILLFFLNDLSTRGSVRIHNNHAVVEGGGVYIYTYSLANLTEGTSISGNTCGHQGAGLVMFQGVTFLADKVVVSGNHIPSVSSGSGAGVLCQGCTMHLSGCHFARNVAPLAAAVSWKGGGTCVGSRFEHNAAHDGGGVGHFSDVSAMLAGNSFFNNSAASDGGCVLSAEASELRVSDSSFDECSAGGNGGAVLVKGSGTVRLSGVVSIQRGAAGGTGGGVHHQGKLLHLEPGATVTVQRNEADGGGGGISLTSEMSIEGQLRVVDNMATEGDGGGVQGVGVYAITSITDAGTLDVIGNEAATGNGGGVALLDNARLAFALPTCPGTCAHSPGTCEVSCLSPECGWDAGECARLFLEAGEHAGHACSRDRDEGCPFWSLVETSQVCSRGCLSSSCDWGFGASSCQPTVDAIGTCPYLNGVIYQSIVANDEVQYIKDGGTAGGFGRCESETCSPADPSIGRDEPYCTSINDGGKIMELDCPECTTAHDTGVEAWGLCAEKDKPRLPDVGFDYDPAELLSVADMNIPAVLGQFSGCGFHPIAIQSNRAALAGGGVYKDRCDPSLEGADRCFIGELDNARLPAVLIDVQDNSAGGPGGGVFVACAQISACLRTMEATTGLPERGNSTQRVMHFGEHTSAEAYGRHVATLPTDLEIVSPPRNYTPGQSLIDLRFRLLDMKGQILHGSEAWPNPHVVEVSVCRLGPSCRAADALQPPFLLRSHATDDDTSILSAVQQLARCPAGESQVQIHLQVAGDGAPGLHKSMVVGCTPCGAGQEMLLHNNDDDNNNEQVWSCKSCQSTEYVVTPLGGCQPCPLAGVSCDGQSLSSDIEGAEWVEHDNTMRVQSCPAGYILVRNPSVPVLDACVHCPPGKYSIQPASYPDSLTVSYAADAPLLCAECVRGAECLGGDDIVSLPGYWEDREARGVAEGEGADGVTLYRCSPGACEGNNTCRDGRNGAVCGLCDAEWSKSGLGCVHCGKDTTVGKVEYMSSFVVTLFAAALAIYFLTWRPLLADYERVITARLSCSSPEQEEKEPKVFSTSRLGMLRHHVSHIQWTSPAMIGAFKVAISFYQVSSTFNITFRIAWPASFDLIFSIGRLTGLDLTQLLPSVACIAQQYSYVDRLLLFTGVFPVTITIVLCLPYLLTRLLGALYHGGSKAHPKHDNVQRSCLRTVLMWFFLIYPTVSEQSLASFLCQDLGSGGHVLVLDTGVRCPWGGSSPSGGFYLALFLVILFPIGIQLFFYYTISSFFVPAMAEAKYSRALFSELIKLYRRETSTAVTMQLAHRCGIVRPDASGAAAPSSPSSPAARTTLAEQTTALRVGEREVASETIAPLRSFKRRVSQLFTQTFIQRELSGEVPEPAVHDKLRHVLEQLGCSEEELLRVVTVVQRLSISTSHSEDLDGFEQLALKIAHNHFLFTGHETLDDLSMEQLQALFLFDWEGLNRKRSDSEIRKRKTRRQQMMNSKNREQLRAWVFSKAKDLEQATRITVPILNWNGESEEEERALGFVGFLFDDFRVQTWWFFLLGEFCKLIMTSVLVFIPGQLWQQLAWGFSVQVCITSLYVVYRPMAEEWLNDFQVYSLCLQCAILFFGLLLSISDEQDRSSAFGPWGDAIVGLKWSLAFFPLVFMLLGKTMRSVQRQVKHRVQGQPDDDAEERNPTCIERLLFPTAANSQVRLRKASLLTETSVNPSLRRNVSDQELLGDSALSTRKTPRFHTGSSVDAQLVTPRFQESPDAREPLTPPEVVLPLPNSARLPKRDEAPPVVPAPPSPEVVVDAQPATGPPAHVETTELELSVIPTPRK